MRSDRVLRGRTGIAAAVTVAGLLAGLGTAAGAGAAAATHSGGAGTTTGVP